MSDFVTLAEAKRWIRIEETGADPHIQAALDRAEAWVAAQCSTAFTQGARTELLTGSVAYLLTAVGPIASVASITDEATGDVLDPTEYGTFRNQIYHYRPPYVRLYWGPGINRWRVVYTGGYTGGAGTHPAPDGLRTPILSLTQQYYLQGDIGDRESAIRAEMQPFKWRVI